MAYKLLSRTMNNENLKYFIIGELTILIVFLVSFIILI